MENVIVRTKSIGVHQKSKALSFITLMLGLSGGPISFALGQYTDSVWLLAVISGASLLFVLLTGRGPRAPITRRTIFSNAGAVLTLLWAVPFLTWSVMLIVAPPD